MHYGIVYDKALYLTKNMTGPIRSTLLRQSQLSRWLYPGLRFWGGRRTPCSACTRILTSVKNTGMAIQITARLEDTRMLK